MAETCCCDACDVRTGTKILAVLNVLVSVYNFLKGVVTLAQIQRLTEDQRYSKQDASSYIALAIFEIIVAIVYLILSIMLFSGAQNRSYRLCRPWLYWNCFMLGFFLIMMIVFFLASGRSDVVGVGPVAIIFGILFVIQLYFVNVAKRFIDELKAS